MNIIMAFVIALQNILYMFLNRFDQFIKIYRLGQEIFNPRQKTFFHIKREPGICYLINGSKHDDRGILECLVF